MIERHADGLREAARYAIQPNMWGFCGEDESQEILRSFVSEKHVGGEKVRETLHSHGFPHLNAFLESISRNSGLDIFDEEVVMSYWIGGPLTEKVGTKNKELLAEIYSDKISPEFSAELLKKLPEEIYLTHLSQVALIAASDYDQKEKTTLINHCMIACGKIVEIDISSKTVKVERDILRPNPEGGYVVEKRKQTVRLDADLTPTINIQDEVTIHLGYLASVISSDTAEKLRYWTRRVASMI